MLIAIIFNVVCANSKKMYETMSDSHKHIKVQVNENEIIFATLNSETKLLWSEIISIDSTEKNFMFEYAKNVRIELPKRIFSSEEEINTFWEMVQNFKNNSKKV